MRLALIFLILFVTSCNPKDYSASWLSEIGQKSFESELTIHRSVAQGAECFVDNWDHAKIKREIQKLEDGYIFKKEVDSKFDFLNLNPSQRHFIYQLGPKADIVFNLESECKDFYCFLNLPYKDESLTAGVRIYHWFLVTGQILSSDDELLQSDELLALSQIAGMLPSTFLNLNFDMPIKSGDITINNKQFEGSFFDNIFEQIAHRKDQGLTNNFYQLKQSLMPWWYENSWNMEEVITRGTSRFRFVSKSDSTYGHPSDEFASLVKASLLAPNQTLANSKKLYNFIVENYLDGQGFDKQALEEFYTQKIQSKIYENAEEAAQNCPAKAYECIQDNLKRLIGNAISEAKLEDYYGHAFWNSSNELSQKLLSFGMTFLQKSKNDHTSEQKQRMITEVLNKCDPRAILFSTFNRKNPRREYHAEFELCLSRFQGKNKDLYKIVNAQMKVNYPYAVVKANISKELNTVFKAMMPIVSERVQTLLNNCAFWKSDNLLFAPFSGGAVYLEGNVLSCINSKINKEIDDILREHLASSYQRAKIGLAYIEAQLLPRFLDELQKQVQSINQSEGRLLASLGILQDKDLEDKIYSQFKNKLNEDSELYFNNCHMMLAPELAAIIKSKVQEIGGPSITLSYHEQATITAQEYCFRIKTRKITERGLEIAAIENQLKNFIDNLHLESNKSWFNKVRSLEHWESTCTSQISIALAPEITKAFIQSFEYYNREQIVNMGFNKICERLKKSFINKMQEFDANLLSQDIAKIYEPLVRKNLEWLKEESEEQMFNKCTRGYSIDLNNNEVQPEYANLSNSIKADILASKLCHRGKMAWRDLKMGLSTIDPTCIKNCWTELNNKIAEYFVKFNDSVLVYMDQAKDAKLISKLLIELNQVLDKQIAHCVESRSKANIIQSKKCLEEVVFIPQNFSNIVRDIYPSGKRMLPGHLQSLNEEFDKRSSSVSINLGFQVPNRAALRPD